MHAFSYLVHNVFFQKQAPKPAKRPACELELYERLKNMQTELSAHRLNFTKTMMGILEKMRKEYESYVEEGPQVCAVCVNLTILFRLTSIYLSQLATQG
jgi:hypothetical protein